MTTISLLLALSAGAAQIDIDAASPYQALNPLYRDFAQGGEYCGPDSYKTLVDPITKLHPRIIRFDHVLNCFTEVRVEKEMVIADFTKLHRMVDLIEQMGAEPLFCLSFTPIAFVGKGRNIDPPPDLKFWRELIVQTVTAMKARPKPARYWEVWNEPNLDIFWTGTLDQYLELYAVTARAVKEADPEAKVGGGGFAGFPQEWVEGLLDRVVRDKLPFDFLSWHEYHTKAEESRDLSRKARQMCLDRDLNVELILDEWNFDAGMVPENDDHRGAVYVADHLRHMMDAPLTYAPFFELKDGVSSDDERYWGRWGLLTSDEKTKASYYCFLAHQELGPQRLSLATSDPDIDGIATLKEKRVVFTLYNRSGEVRDVTVNLNNLPITDQSASWKRRLIDAGHSNPARGTPEQLQTVEDEFPASSPQANRYTRALSLPPGSVSLCEFAADAGPAPKVECRMEPAPETGYHDNRKWFVLSVYNPNTEPVVIANFRALSDAGQSLDLSQMGAPANRPVILPMRLDSKAAVKFLTSIPIPLTASPYDVYVRAEVELKPLGTARCGASFRVEPSLDLQLSPQKADWPRGLEPAEFQLTMANRAPHTLSGSLQWNLSRNLSITPALPEQYSLESTNPVASVFTAQPADENITSPTVETVMITVRASLPGAPAGNDTMESRLCLVPAFAIPLQLVSGSSQEVYPGFTSHHATGRISFYKPRDEWSAFWLSWTEEHLYFRMEVRDASHVQNHSGALLWNGDSIQMAFDMDWDAVPGREGYDDDDVEIGFALGSSGPEAWRWKAPEGVPSGKLDIPLTIMRAEDSTVYEAQISWSLLGREKMKPREGFGFSLLLNDEDGQGRRNASWAGGIALKKEPWRFFHIVADEKRTH